jgi:dTDP-glucose pyrophosphorylase/predicted transcriptional regulator
MDDVVLPPTAALRRALEVLDRTGKEIILVCADGRRLLGTVTDGDVRRALLAGAALEETQLESVMHREYTSVSPEAGRAEVLDTMRARGLAQIPVVDATGTLVGLHTMQAVVGAVERPNAAVLMAGGRGTRLGTITQSVPKPMVKVAGRPILERIVLHLVGFGIRDIYLAVHYLSEQIEDHFGDGSAFGCRIRYIREQRPLGTGGCLSLLPERPTTPLLLMNGDLVTQVDVGRMLAAHELAAAAATIGVREYVVDVPFGVVDIDESGRVIAIREKPTVRMPVSAGIYVLSPEVIDMVPPDCELPVTDLFRRCIDARLRVATCVVEEDWIDVGRPEELLRANGRL